jgi:hypothetical protein
MTQARLRNVNTAVGSSAFRTREAEDLLHLPDELAGAEASIVRYLAADLVHLPRKVAGVLPAI